MGVKNGRKKRRNKEKKEAAAPPLSSSGREDKHFIMRSVQRNGNFMPFCPKKIKRMIHGGLIKVEKAKYGRKKLTFPDGTKIITDGKYKNAITYLE
jgi:hypothetical protein